MSDYQLGAVESRFADIIWEREPVTAVELCKICERELSWKKTTTYTVLRRLCDKGIFKNESGTVTSVISKDRFFSLRTEQFVRDTFDGSLPAFITAFCSGKKLSREEIEYLKKFVEEYGEQ